MLNSKFSTHDFILASKSPRRAELLSLIGLEFTSTSLEVDESYPKGLKRAEITEYITNKKAEAFVFQNERQIILTADTLVWSDVKALGKPKDFAEAKEMLHALLGKEHEIITSFCIKSLSKKVVKTDVAKVKFNLLSRQEIDYYINTFQTLDKAGAYGIQDWIGAIGISQIVGSYYTIMGLPTHLVYRELIDF